MRRSALTRRLKKQSEALAVEPPQSLRSPKIKGGIVANGGADRKSKRLQSRQSLGSGAGARPSDGVRLTT